MTLNPSWSPPADHDGCRPSWPWLASGAHGRPHRATGRGGRATPRPRVSLPRGAGAAPSCRPSRGGRAPGVGTPGRALARAVGGVAPGGLGRTACLLAGAGGFAARGPSARTGHATALVAGNTAVAACRPRPGRPLLALGAATGLCSAAGTVGLPGVGILGVGTPGDGTPGDGTPGDGIDGLASWVSVFSALVAMSSASASAAMLRAAAVAPMPVVSPAVSSESVSSP